MGVWKITFLVESESSLVTVLGRYHREAFLRSNMKPSRRERK